MTVMEFFGCTFMAFGPPLALFIFTVARDPLRVIVLMASAFFWLLSLLLSSLWWYVVIPLREDIAFGLVFSVIFQEVFRLCFYLLLKKAEEGLRKVWQEEAGGSTVTMVNNRHLMAYVAGFGYGVICGAFSLVNVLADMTGPGTIGIYGDPQEFFIASAFMTLCMILLHIFWGIVFYNGLDRGAYIQPIVVVLTHMLVSCLTLLNQMEPPQYLASLLPAYAILVAMGTWSFFIVGGSRKNIQSFFSNRRREYSID